MINNNDFKKYISNFQWKMQFNLNQAQKIIFQERQRRQLFHQFTLIMFQLPKVMRHVQKT